jgi:folate-binding protein YgfZ
MSDAANMDVSATLTSADHAISSLTTPTVLASALGLEVGRSPLSAFAGRLTATQFLPLEGELHSMLQGCGIYDLGWRARIAVRGEDRLRWLSGMVTNAVQQLDEYAGNYSFFLNAQGRIQGDAFIFRDADQLLLDTSADQIEPLLAHLDRFIIMDDVTLEGLACESSSIGLAGPQAAAVLAGIGIATPDVHAESPMRFHAIEWDGIELTVIAQHGLLAPQFEITCPAADIGRLWQRLLGAGAQPCGIRAVEALRILDGLPRYGVDIIDRDLPQETSQTRALNFNKGCYLGQEIVERIRSRGAVHRALRQFSLRGEAPSLPADLVAGGKGVGKLTSAVSLVTASGPATYALGIVRLDGASRGETLTYNGGEAQVLDRPPSIVLP